LSCVDADTTPKTLSPRMTGRAKMATSSPLVRATIGASSESFLLEMASLK
jgi:hypothetical protein